MFHVLTLTYLQPLDVLDATRPQHLAWVAEEIADGRLILAGRQADQSGGVLVTGDLSADEADTMVAGDPYQQAGLVRYQRLSFEGAFRADGL